MYAWRIVQENNKKGHPVGALQVKQLEMNPIDYFTPYFWRNLSTRPAVSTILCLPV